MLQICKTMSDDTGRVPLHVDVICLHIRRKLQCQLILERRCKNSRCVHVSPADMLQVSLLHAAKGDSSRCNYDGKVLRKS